MRNYLLLVASMSLMSVILVPMRHQARRCPSRRWFRRDGGPASVIAGCYPGDGTVSGPQCRWRQLSGAGGVGGFRLRGKQVAGSGHHGPFGRKEGGDLRRAPSSAAGRPGLLAGDLLPVGDGGLEPGGGALAEEPEDVSGHPLYHGSLADAAWVAAAAAVERGDPVVRAGVEDARPVDGSV